MNFFPNLNKKVKEMRLVKPNDYSLEDWKIAYTGDALSHPVRKKIIEHLSIHGGNTRTDYSKLMNLSKLSISQHMDKLFLANLIDRHYGVHFESLVLNTEELEHLYDFLGRILGKH